MELTQRLNEKKRQFEELRSSVSGKRARLGEVEQELATVVQCLGSIWNDPPKRAALLNRQFDLKEEQRKLCAEIQRIEDRTDETEFWFDFAELIREQSRPPPEPTPQPRRELELVHGGSSGSEEEVDYVEQSDSEEYIESTVIEAKPIVKRQAGLLVEHFIDNQGTRNQEAQKQMIQMIEGGRMPSQVVHVLDQLHCQSSTEDGVCGGDLVLQREAYRCLKCNALSELEAKPAPSQYVLAKTPADRERVSYVAQYTYKKINHFKDWLSQFQAKENTQIPEEVLDKVRVALVQKRIKNFDKITPKKIWKVLKEISLPKMYEHRNLICNKISGNPPPFLTAEQERKLRDMFEELQAPFERHKVKGRKNFLSYSYTLHKLLQILGMPKRIYGQFKILQGPQLVALHDETWKKMMAELDARKALGISWPFYPSQ